MANRLDMKDWVLEALIANGSACKLVFVARHIWENYRAELEHSGDLLYTWQYDMRWAATLLRKEGKLKTVNDTPRGIWATT